MALFLELPSAHEDLDQLVQAPLGCGKVLGEQDDGEPRVADRSEDLDPDLLPNVVDVIVHEAAKPSPSQLPAEVR